LVFTLILTLLSSCEKSKKRPDVSIETSTFRKIPNITREEINAIEVIKKEYGSFHCAIELGTDSFYDKNGGLSGYAVLFYDWLSRFFEIPFKPVFYEEPGSLVRRIDNNEIDFTIELTDTPERRAAYFMTRPIAQRPFTIYRIAGSPPLANIINSRKPRYAFLTNSVLLADATANTGYEFETVFVNDHIEAYPLLKNGVIDGYIAIDNTEAAFDKFGNVVGENFFPLIFRSSSLLTGKEELKPIINILDKALDVRTLSYLSELRRNGYQKYLGNKLYAQLNKEERSYINEHSGEGKRGIPIAAEFNNYPVSFFDAETDQWQGIFFDALNEISNMTGVKFECVNDPDTQYPELIAMLEKGEALIIPELFHIKENEGRFLWSQVPLLRDNYAFITISDFHNIDISGVTYLHVGFRKNTHYAELFKKMFPDHPDFTEYNTQEETWNALKNGEIDAIFSSRRRLVIYTNYHEEAGFKLNLLFENEFDTSFGYNRDAAVLRSIIDKSLGMIKINSISNQWMNRSYDYRAKLTAARFPWLIGVSVLISLILVLVLVLLTRSRNIGKKLETQVNERTRELSFETSKLQAIINSIPDILFCKDTNLKYTQCNTPFQTFLGIEESKVLGKADREGTWLLPEDAEKIYGIEKTVIREKQILKLEENILSPLTGRKKIFETIRAPIRQDGVVVGLIAVVRDITRRKAMEDEIRTALQSKTNFLARMSHELRTPLNVVIGLTDLILDDARIDVYIANNVLKINNAGSTLLSIVNDILDFSKVESGKLEITPVEYYTASVLNDIVTVVITRLGEKPVKFNLDIKEDMPEILLGDDLRVKQILINLLNNAVKFTREGNIELSIRCTREENAVWMDIAVSDTGIGIRENDLKKLFEDYYQINEKATRSVEGTGLGLAITKKLVDLMNGTISAESEYGKGTTFRLRLKQGFISNAPLGMSTVEKLRSFQYAQDKRHANKRILRLDLSYARVLVVDDVLTNLDVAAGLLRKYRMQVDCLDNGPAAIERIREGTPVYNAVFMDHMMPDMDGIETADRIRALGTEYARKLPIIALSANAIHGTEQLFYEHDFQAFITKPIDLTELDLAVKKWVRDENRDDIPVIIEPVSNESVIPVEIDIPDVDSQKGLSLYAGNTGVYLSLLRSYVANTPILLEKLRVVTENTLPKYNVSVHGLKGSSANIGAESIREQAFELEKISREGNLQGVWALNGKLIADTKLVIANIEAWLKQYDASKEKKPVRKAPDRELLKQLRQSCKKYDIRGADKILSVLESSDYEQDADLVSWVRNQIEISNFTEAAQKLEEVLSS
jgi:PAS domain S-box-containing protein